MDKHKNSIRNFINKNKKITSDIGDIDVGENIGQGGNALVYSCSFGKSEAAIKILAEDINAGSSKVERFIMEFREIVKLADSKAVVPIYFYGYLDVEEYKFPYYVMKKFPLTLKEWVEIGEKKDSKNVIELLNKILLIVEQIHEKKIVHRDLKPENILVDNEDNYFLADFGIAWFDPEIYLKKVKTKSGDRMANFGFSAPEQWKKGVEPHQTMDIFAIAQIITWVITGDTVRGTRRPLNEIDGAYTTIEPVIRQMLEMDPTCRPQSIAEVKKLLSEKIRMRERTMLEKYRFNLAEFDKVLSKNFPGERGLILVESQTKIDQILLDLEEVQELNLWWTQGYPNDSVGIFRKLDNNVWLMGNNEIKIEKIWINKLEYENIQFILIKTAAMPKFEYKSETELYVNNEAAWFNGGYITIEEFNDGYAKIGGETIEVCGEAQVRVRSFVGDYYFVSTWHHAISIIENDTCVDAVYQNLKLSNELCTEGYKKLLGMKKTNNIVK